MIHGSPVYFHGSPASCWKTQRKKLVDPPFALTHAMTGGLPRTLTTMGTRALWVGKSTPMAEMFQSLGASVGPHSDGEPRHDGNMHCGRAGAPARTRIAERAASMEATCHFTPL